MNFDPNSRFFPQSLWPYAGAAYVGTRAMSRRLSANPTFAGKGSAGSTVMRRRPAKSRKTFAKRVRSLAPYKHNTLNDTTNQTAMTHGTIYTTNLTSKVGQGTTNTDRIGDFIHPVSLKCRGVINTPATTGAFEYRILVGYSGEEYNVSASNAGLITSEIFLPSTGAGFTTNAIVNPKAFTCLYDEVVDINSLVATASDLKSVAFTVPLAGKFPYQSTGSVFGKVKNLYMVVIGNVIGGVVGTTATGTYLFNTDLVFQDS